MIDPKRLTISCASTWIALDVALRDGTDLPDQLRESLHHARTALNMCSEQLHAHIVSSGLTEVERSEP